MARKAVTAGNLFAAGPYSHAIEAGDLIFLSGKTGTDPAGKLMPGGISQETLQTFANLKTVLTAAGLSFDHVVKCNVYLTDMTEFQAMNKVYAEHFAKPEPARTTVAVAALPGGARVEIEMVAKK